MMNIDYNLIGKRIQESRKSKNMTQEQLAEKLDVTVGYVSQLERGISKISLDTLAKISAIIDCDITFFLSDSAVYQSDYLSCDLFEKYHSMTPNQKKMLLHICDSIIEYSEK